MGVSEALFTWLVYTDRFPLAVPELLGELEAPDKPAAEKEAAAQWPGVALLIQSAASARVRPVTALPLPDAPTASQQTRVAPKKRGKYTNYHRQLDAFAAAKRRAHEARRADRQP